MKNIVIALTGLFLFVVSAQAQTQEVEKKGWWKRTMGKVIKFNHKPGDEIARYTSSSSYKSDTRVIARSHSDGQWGVPQSYFPPQPRRSTTIIDTGRTRYEKHVDGSQYYSEGYDWRTGQPVVEVTTTSSTYESTTKVPPYRIPYNQLPDRGSSLSMPKGYHQTVVGVVPLKSFSPIR